MLCLMLRVKDTYVNQLRYVCKQKKTIQGGVSS